jgi:hypothetical protein
MIRQRRGREAADDASLDQLRIGRMTWTGFVVVAGGWAALLGTTTLSDVLLAKHPLSAAIHADLTQVSICLILSGFGLAIVGALHTGFGTLNRFFSAVLNRSVRRDVGSVEPVVDRPQPAPAKPAGQRRPYRLMADGSVEVETIVGTRIFRTMAEAREFI